MDFSPLVQVAFYGILIIFTTFTAILFYHWQNYALSRSATIQTYIAYSIVTLPLIVIMSVIAFSLS